METFLTILIGVLVLAVILKIVKVMFWIAFKTAIGSLILFAGLLTGIFYLVK